MKEKEIESKPYLVAYTVCRVIEIKAENEFDALEQAKRDCKGNEQVGEILQAELTPETKANVIVKFD